jgi:hypothetical protein
MPKRSTRLVQLSRKRFCYPRLVLRPRNHGTTEPQNHVWQPEPDTNLRNPVLAEQKLSQSYQPAVWRVDSALAACPIISCAVA